MWSLNEIVMFAKPLHIYCIVLYYANQRRRTTNHSVGICCPSNVGFNLSFTFLMYGLVFAFDVDAHETELRVGKLLDFFSSDTNVVYEILSISCYIILTRVNQSSVGSE